MDLEGKNMKIPGVYVLWRPTTSAGRCLVAGFLTVVRVGLARCPRKRPAWSFIQQPVPHCPDHDLLLRVDTRLHLNSVSARIVGRILAESVRHYRIGLGERIVLGNAVTVRERG